MNVNCLLDLELGVATRLEPLVQAAREGPVGQRAAEQHGPVGLLVAPHKLFRRQLRRSLARHRVGAQPGAVEARRGAQPGLAEQVAKEAAHRQRPRGPPQQRRAKGAAPAPRPAALLQQQVLPQWLVSAEDRQRPTRRAQPHEARRVQIRQHAEQRGILQRPEQTHVLPRVLCLLLLSARLAQQVSPWSHAPRMRRSLFLQLVTLVRLGRRLPIARSLRRHDHVFFYILPREGLRRFVRSLGATQGSRERGEQCRTPRKDFSTFSCFSAHLAVGNLFSRSSCQGRVG